MPLCSPWVDAGDVELCAEVTDLDLLVRATTVASELLYALTGRQFSGVCTDVVRPCRWSDGVWAHGAWAHGPWVGWGRPPQGCYCAGPVSCSRNHDALPLPHTPIIDVTEVLVDGVAIEDAPLVVDDRWLVRPDGQYWPSTQYLDRLADQEGTWQVTYTYGTEVPADAVLAAEVLACELARSWTASAGCRLPRNVTSVIAENVSYDMGPPEPVTQALLNLPEVASLIAAHNPHRLMRRGRFINPRAHGRRRARRVRTSTPTPGLDTYSGGSPSDTGSDIYDGGTPGDTGDDIYSGGTP